MRKAMSCKKPSHITDIVGRIQYRLALAGGWIDQPFISKHNPSPPGAMVVVAIEPEFRFMDRAGIGGSTRTIALEIWNGEVPDEDPIKLVRQLYEIENKDKPNPSGSQDMIGIIYPGISRLDYDYANEGGYFPKHIESNNDIQTAQWLENNLYILPVNTRPDGYNPLDRQNLTPEWVARLGQSGKDCFDAIVNHSLNALGASMNECMKCWYVLLPDIFEHPTLQLNLLLLLEYYQANYAGAMYSGCGGGYLFVASDRKVPGAFQVKIRTGK
jgi:hypothetical protein